MREQPSQKEYLERQRRNREIIDKSISKLNHPDIRLFCDKHLGLHEPPDYGIAAFIPVETFHRDSYDAIYSLLLFLDDNKYGEEHLAIGISGKTTTLREHTLRVTDVMIQSVTKKWRGSSYYLFRAGMAALSYNIGLGLGSQYCKQFIKKGESFLGQVSIGQASLALLEQMPAVSSSVGFEEIQDIIRLFSLCVDSNINRPKFPFERGNISWDLVRLLSAAELRVRREEIFNIWEMPSGLWYANKEIKEKKAKEAAEVAEQAVSERQLLNIKELNRDALLEEINGLRNRAAQCKLLKKEAKIMTTIISAQGKVIEAHENKDTKALKLAQKGLEKAEMKLQIFLTTKFSDSDEKISTKASGQVTSDSIQQVNKNAHVPQTQIGET